MAPVPMSDGSRERYTAVAIALLLRMIPRYDVH
jgi:hypothetical protein